MTAPPSFKFTEDQLEGLKGLGALDGQIKALEQVLPLCFITMASPAPMAEVLDELQELARTLKAASIVATRILSATPDRRAQQEAKVRLQVAAWEEDKGLPPEARRALDGTAGLAKVVDAIGIASDYVARALADHPSEQSRSRVSPRAVAMIDAALARSWEDRARPYPFEVKSTEESPFVQAVTICWDAMGHDGGPLRAVRAYVGARSDHRDNQRRDLANDQFEGLAEWRPGDPPLSEEVDAVTPHLHPTPKTRRRKQQVPR